MVRRGNRLIPARNAAPGMIVRKELDARCWTQEDLARIMGRPVQVISEVVSGKKQITPETALGLAAAFGSSAEMWLSMEARYRLRLVQERIGTDNVKRRSRIYSLVPVKEITRRGWIGESEGVDDLEKEVKEFLRVRSFDELPPLKVAARRTVTKEPDQRAVLAWIRRIEQLAAAQEVGVFDRNRLKDGVNELLDLAGREDGLVLVAGVLKDLGIHFVIVPHLPKTSIDGAVLAADGNPLVALTLRYDRIDAFWFTLMHEMAHLVLDHRGSRLEDLDGEAGGDSEEAEADVLAAEWLVPGDALTDFVQRVKPHFSRHAIWSFARSVGRHPAIVLGRLQHDGHVSYAHLQTSIPSVRRFLERLIDVSEPILDVGIPSFAASVRERGAPYDPEGALLEWLREHSGWHSPAEIKDALNLDRSIWNRVIRTLVLVGQVERSGEKRGTKYRAVR